jgi:hypothetical protein
LHCLDAAIGNEKGSVPIKLSSDEVIVDKGVVFNGYVAVE